MSMFRKKPVTIEAVQWTGSNLREVITFTDGPPDTRTQHAGMMWENYEDLVRRDGLKIFTLEGAMLASPGDWIIKGVKGEFYPCKPDIFAATYEPAGAEALRSESARTEYERWDGDSVGGLPPSFTALVVEAMVEAQKAMRKFPQPNYVISKFAEEAGEVVKAAIHHAEGRETREAVVGEMRQVLAMMLRLWIEGDQVHGMKPLALLTQEGR